MKSAHTLFRLILPLAALSCGQASAADQKALGVNPYDFLVYAPAMPQRYEQCEPTERGDRYNDHFQVLYDTNRKTYFAFWTQASKEADKDMHVVFSKSADLRTGWTKPIVLAGCERRSEPCPTACWQQPMLSAKGRLYCLWNQQLGDADPPPSANACAIRRRAACHCPGRTFHDVPSTTIATGPSRNCPASERRLAQLLSAVWDFSGKSPGRS